MIHCLDTENGSLFSETFKECEEHDKNPSQKKTKTS